MSTKLYVGNVPFSTTTQDLQSMFAQQGTVESVELISDKFTGRSRGFAFVSMATPEEGQKAIQALNGFSIEGRALTVNEARPKEDRPPRSGGFGGGSRGGFGGGRGGDRGDRGGFGGGDRGERRERRY